MTAPTQQDPVGRELTWDEVHEFGLEPVPDGIGPSVEEVEAGETDLVGNPREKGEG